VEKTGTCSDINRGKNAIFAKKMERSEDIKRRGHTRVYKKPDHGLNLRDNPDCNKRDKRVVDLECSPGKKKLGKNTSLQSPETRQGGNNLICNWGNDKGSFKQGQGLKLFLGDIDKKGQLGVNLHFPIQKREIVYGV